MLKPNWEDSAPSGIAKLASRCFNKMNFAFLHATHNAFCFGFLECKFFGLLEPRYAGSTVSVVKNIKSQLNKTLRGLKMKTRQLNADEKMNMERERYLIRDMQNADEPSNFITKTVQDLPLLQSLLQALWDSSYLIDDPATGMRVALSAICTSFGDVFVTELSMHWIMVIDEDDVSLALRYKNADIFIHPMDMIMKRLVNNEALDFPYLFAHLKKVIPEMANDPGVYGNLDS